jgi:excisionase family DNA binding protein
MPGKDTTIAAPVQDTGNATAEKIVARLPQKPVLNAAEVADALFLADSRSVVAAIDEGSLSAIRVGKQYRIHRREAERRLSAQHVALEAVAALMAAARQEEYATAQFGPRGDEE